MGYRTDFSGELKFAVEPTPAQLEALRALCGEDCRDHPEWGTSGLSYIDLRITSNCSGLEWSYDSYSYDLEGVVNVVLREMRKQWPEFGLTGSLLAQGEDISDRWALVIGEDGWACSRPIVIREGGSVSCPHCGEKFTIEE